MALMQNSPSFVASPQHALGRRLSIGRACYPVCDTAQAQTAPGRRHLERGILGKEGRCSALSCSANACGAPKSGRSGAATGAVSGSRLVGRAVAHLVRPPVTGQGEYSLMNVFAKWALTSGPWITENYGKSGRTSGNSDIASGAQDLKGRDARRCARDRTAESAFLWANRPAVYAPGFTRPSQPERVDRLVLCRLHLQRQRRGRH